MARRLFSRRLLKLGEIPRLTVQNRCSIVFFINPQLNHPNPPIFTHCQQNISRFYSTKKPDDSECCKRHGKQSDPAEKPEESAEEPKEEKLSLFQRFKKMYRDYWYVLVPVHVVTSAGWLGGFYYLAKSGVDIVSLLETLQVSERITNNLKDSHMGYFAITYALYKIATPVRYTVTLGGTTVSINYLKKWGYIKPVPSAERLKELYHERKDTFIETLQDTKDGLKHQKEKLKDKKDDLIEDLKTMKRIKSKVLLKKKPNKSD